MPHNFYPSTTKKRMKRIQINRWWATIGFSTTMPLMEETSSHMYILYEKIYNAINKYGSSNDEVYIGIINGMSKFHTGNKYPKNKFIRETDNHVLIKVIDTFTSQHNININNNDYIKNTCKNLITIALNTLNGQNPIGIEDMHMKNYLIIAIGINVKFLDADSYNFTNICKTINNLPNDTTSFYKLGFIKNDFITISYQFEYPHTKIPDLNIALRSALTLCTN